LDIYAYVGDEYAARAQYKGYSSVSVKTSTAYFPAPPPADPTAPTPPNIAVVTNTFTTSNTGTGGYGARNANNSGCSLEVTPTNQNTPGSGACAGDVRNIIEGSLGFWHKFYNGPKGRVQWGLQYAYFTKSGWSGNAGIAPKAVDNMVWSSFRYYLP
jgi:hypothetical protein